VKNKINRVKGQISYFIIDEMAEVKKMANFVFATKFS